MLSDQPEKTESVMAKGKTNKVLRGLREFTNYTLTVEALSANGTSTSAPHHFFVREGLPWRPTNAVVTHTNDSSKVGISWDCRTPIGGGPDSFNLTLEGEDTPTKTSTNMRQLLIAELKLNTTYVVSIAGFNKLGIGPPALVTFNTFPKPSRKRKRPRKEPPAAAAAPRLDVFRYVTTTDMEEVLYQNDAVANQDEENEQSSGRIMDLLICKYCICALSKTPQFTI